MFGLFVLGCMHGIMGENWYSRLGELARRSPKILPRALAQAVSHVLSDALSRSSEKGSPERELVKSPRGHCCMSRLGESPQF
ncbi:hypothetical protein DEO72_LG2g3934 [Vigna unguiculata]|uniref:Uncharacterized protein n=1 Tax=Vigna unguiculata TaxID=3917 RepID=A0A4D6L517_VIGUN|nr:hypothetical protein DEO72_LG2g3934 [Vigna unguiculata]